MQSAAEVVDARFVPAWVDAIRQRGDDQFALRVDPEHGPGEACVSVAIHAGEITSRTTLTRFQHKAQAAPMTVKLVSLVGQRGEDWQLLASGAFVSLIIPLIVFLALQRYFVRGLLAGSVKG